MKKTFKISLTVFVIVGFLASYVLMLIPDLKYLSYFLSPLVGIAFLYLFLGEDLKKDMKDKSLYEKTYGDFYKGFGREDGKLRIINKIFKGVEYCCVVAALGTGLYLIYGLLFNTAGYSKIIYDALFFVVTAGLAVHFHDANKLTKAIARINSGEVINSRELKRLKAFGKLGRYSHLVAFAGLLTYLIIQMIDRPIFLIMAPIVPFWGYFTIYIGYGALYSAMSDYVTGERK